MVTGKLHRAWHWCMVLVHGGLVRLQDLIIGVCFWMRCVDIIIVRKSTREVTTLGREGVLPWYKGKGSEMENPELYFLDLILVDQKCKVISFNQLFLSKGQSLYVTSMVKPPTFKVYFFGI